MNILHGNCDFDYSRKKKHFFKVSRACCMSASQQTTSFITKEDGSLELLEQLLVHFLEARRRCAAELLYARLGFSFHNSLTCRLYIL